MNRVDTTCENSKKTIDLLDRNAMDCALVITSENLLILEKNRGRGDDLQGALNRELKNVIARAGPAAERGYQDGGIEDDSQD